MRLTAEINGKKILNNIKFIRNKLSPPTKICAVIKANAYGHGDGIVSRVIKDKVDFFAFATYDEALKFSYIKKPVLILSYTDFKKIKKIPSNFEFTVFNDYHLKCLKTLKRKIKVHIKIDTGFSRLGAPWEKSEEFIKKALKIKNMEIKGVYSHLSCADNKNDGYNVKQLNKFKKTKEFVKKINKNIICHFANSAGILLGKDYHFDMVRPGIMLYGLSPYKIPLKGLEPAMILKAKILSVLTLPKNTGVSYAKTYITKGKEKIAVISCGYGDGIFRSLSNKGCIFYKGKKYKIAGNVCMDLFCVKADKNFKLNDHVEIMGDNIRAEETARLAGTINYEIISSLSPRVMRKLV